jgi:crotonobetainyl-CoA:carnitine CoA-transferase CaiB-like acyl-CoA transferase
MTTLAMEDAAQRGGVERPDLPGHYGRLQGEMEALFASRTTQEWQRTFEAAGVPASSVKFPVELADDPQVTANGFVHDVEHPTVGAVRVLAPPVRLDGGGFVPAPATAAFASETYAILTELGFDEDDIEELINSGATRWQAVEGTRE